ncbi:MAG TPA: hypothetical protein VGR28_11265, partial [Candidatus Thermoplasmatota archaeon]|nr:hypothetical protein [Candidatus Thermoplasmatota archaeon]
MAIALEPVTMLQWLSGLLLLALGLWVLTLRPRRGATVLFAVFAACFGFATFLINVFAGASTPSVRQVAGLVEVPAYVALVLLVWRFPARLPAAARPGAAMAGALAAGHAALIIGLFAAAAPREWPAFCCRGAASGQSTVLNFSEP